MATLLIRWLVAWSVCAFIVAEVMGENLENDKSQLYTETKELLKKRIMEEEILVKFLNQLSRITRGLQLPGRRPHPPISDMAAKRIGSEFLGKRGTNTALEQAEDESSQTVTTAAMLANQLLNFDTSTSKKRLGSEFLGKRGLIGSEFVGKRSLNDHLTVTSMGQSSDHVMTSDDIEENSHLHSKK